ncbi:16126_t:CDS:2 [Entrophospora sp. SA101]|nr:16126_t:CDS:2 [Entrophospora sp. SA101]
MNERLLSTTIVTSELPLKKYLQVFPDRTVIIHRSPLDGLSHPFTIKDCTPSLKGKESPVLWKPII